jgi:hypothetical protein
VRRHSGLAQRAKSGIHNHKPRGSITAGTTIPNFWLKTFSRRRRVDGERMDAAGKLIGERRIDHTMALEPALSPKGRRYNIDSEMRLAARPVAGVTMVLMRFILDIEAFGCESVAQLFCDQIARVHERWLSQHTRTRSIANADPLQMRSIANHVHFCRLSSLEAAMQAPA